MPLGEDGEMIDVFLHARPIAYAWNEPETDASPGEDTEDTLCHMIYDV